MPGVTLSLAKEPAVAANAAAFDVSLLAWNRGILRRADIPQGSWMWSVDGGVRFPGTAYASWFGAREGAGIDNSKALQVMLQSGARDAVLDGFYDHIANWLGDGQVLRGMAPFGGGGRFGLRTIPHPQDFDSLLRNRDPRFPREAAFRGLSTVSGASSAEFRDFEYDGSARQSRDHADGYRAYLAAPQKGKGKQRLRRYRLRQGGINLGMTGRKEDYVAPARTLMERLYIHNTVRNCIVANEAPNVTIRDCRLADSDTDHLIYADRNPDLVVERTVFSGYACDGMLVISGGNIQDCVFTDLQPNPTAELDINFLISLRNDIAAPARLSRLSIEGDLSAIMKAPGEGAVIRFAGERQAEISQLQVRHRGPDDTRFSVFGAEFSASSIKVIEMMALGMPRGARLWKTDMTIRDLEMRNVAWASSTMDSYPELMHFGSLKRYVFSDFDVQGGAFTRLANIQRPPETIDLRSVAPQ